MIRTESEYKEAVNRYKEEVDALDGQRNQLVTTGLSKSEVERAMQPLTSFHLQLSEEITWYENVRRGRLAPIRRLTDIGRLLIAARIRSGLTQAQLARKLDVSEAAVSRDERNEYHAITVERAQRILDALGAEFELSVGDKCHHVVRPADRRSKNSPKLTIA